MNTGEFIFIEVTTADIRGNFYINLYCEFKYCFMFHEGCNSFYGMFQDFVL